MSDSTLHPGGIVPLDALNRIDNHPELDWLTSSSLCVVVIGASGDLAKKKTYPSLLDLYDDNLLPRNVKIYGLARSKLEDDDLRARLRPYLQKQSSHSEEVIDRFLQRCFYQWGSSYGDMDAYTLLNGKMKAFEDSLAGDQQMLHKNRLFYFAIRTYICSFRTPADLHLPVWCL
jgi:glucose-6-phosphate 1-dehydrogenase